MPFLKSRPPKYCRYREGARVTIQGQTHYLPGKYNSDESLTEYRRLVAQWGAGIPADPVRELTADAISVAELLAAYVDHSAKYYGEDSNRFEPMRRVAVAVSEVYDALPANKFSPKKLQTVRQVFRNVYTFLEEPGQAGS